MAPPSFTFVFAVLGRFKHRQIYTQRAIRDIKKLEAATRAFVFAFTFHAFTFHHCLTLADDRFGCFNKVEPQEFNVEQVAQFWLTEAEEALHVADHLMEKADYSYALFFDHLAVEKLLKALYAIRLHEHAPPVHNLVRLSRAVGLDLDEKRLDALITITAFNIEARYPDLERTFRRKCTPAYSGEQMAVIKELFKCLRSQII